MSCCGKMHELETKITRKGCMRGRAANANYQMHLWDFVLYGWIVMDFKFNSEVGPLCWSSRGRLYGGYNLWVDILSGETWFLERLSYLGCLS